jgi:hypothetical protein
MARSRFNDPIEPMDLGNMRQMVCTKCGIIGAGAA